MFIPLRIFNHKDLSLVKFAGQRWEFVFLSCLWVDCDQNSHAKMSLLSAKKSPEPKIRLQWSKVLPLPQYFFVPKQIAFSRVPNILLCFSKNPGESKFGLCYHRVLPVLSPEPCMHGTAALRCLGQPQVFAQTKKHKATLLDQTGPSSEVAGERRWEAPCVFSTLIFWWFINHLTNSGLNIHSENLD